MSTKRNKIPVLDGHKDLYELFDEQDPLRTPSDSAAEGGESFSRMLDDALSGVDQAEIIRQKYPDDEEQGHKKKRTSFAGNPQADLDLHGCHVREALVRVEIFIETSALQGLKAVRIIVGKGLHSQGSAVLPDAVAEKIVDLKRRGRVATFAWDKKRKSSSGALLVYLAEK